MNKKISMNVFTNIVNILFLIVLENFVLDSGMGFFGASCFCIVLLYRILFGGLQSGIAKMVSIRNHKGLNGNAERILKPAIVYVLVVGIVLAMVVFLFSDTFSVGIWGISYTAPVLKVLALLIVVNGIVDALCGYHNGNGNMVVLYITNGLRMILPILFSFMILPFFEKYGNKVAALLKNPLVTSAYSALAVVCIYAVSSVVILIVVIILAIRLRMPHENDKPARNMNSLKSMYGGVIISSLRTSVHCLFPVLSFAFVAAFYLHYAYKYGVKPESAFMNVGIIFAKLLLPICLVLAIFSEYIAREKHRLYLDLKKEEHKTGLIRAQYMIKNSFFMLLPPTIILTFLADPFVKVFYSGQYTLSFQVVKTGGFLLIFAGVAYSMNAILKGIDKERTALAIQLFAFFIQMVFLFVMLSSTSGNSLWVLYSFYLYYGIQIVINFVVAYRYMRFDLIDILIKLGKYGLAAIVMMILFIILDKFVLMNVLLICLSMFLGYLLYYLTLLALKGISKKDEMALKRTLNYYPVAFLKRRLRL